MITKSYKFINNIQKIQNKSKTIQFPQNAPLTRTTSQPTPNPHIQLPLAWMVFMLRLFSYIIITSFILHIKIIIKHFILRRQLTLGFNKIIIQWIFQFTPTNIRKIMATSWISRPIPIDRFPWRWYIIITTYFKICKK